MSGRVRTTLADGRRVRGYRKTLRRNLPRSTPAHETPKLRLIFLLPATLAFATAPRMYGQFAKVGPAGNVEVTASTFNRDVVLQRAADLLREITPKGHMPYSVCAVLKSSSDPDFSGKWRLAFCDRHVVAAMSPIEPLIFPAAA
jgi:hypothetical protein